MRWTIMAAVAVAAMLTITACQDQQARAENARLEAELKALKENQNSGGDNGSAFEQWLLAQSASKDDGALDKKMNSLGEDLNAGLADLKEAQKLARENQQQRMDNLEARIDKVGDLDKSLASVEGMINKLEGKVHDVDPNETLTYIKEKMEAEAALKAEQDAHAKTAEKIDALNVKLEERDAQIQKLNDDRARLSESDISGHPDYKKIRVELREAKDRINELEKQYNDLKEMYDRLLLQVGEGPDSDDGEASDLPDNYDFSGNVVSVKKGVRPDGPSILLVEDIKGSVPPIGAQLVVLDARNEPVCNIKVIRHYHFSDDEDLPIESVGAETLDEIPTRPVAKGDRVLWITEEDDTKGTAGGE